MLVKLYSSLSKVLVFKSACFFAKTGLDELIAASYIYNPFAKLNIL